MSAQQPDDHSSESSSAGYTSRTSRSSMSAQQPNDQVTDGSQSLSRSSQASGLHNYTIDLGNRPGSSGELSISQGQEHNQGVTGRSPDEAENRSGDVESSEEEVDAKHPHGDMCMYMLKVLLPETNLLC